LKLLVEEARVRKSSKRAKNEDQKFWVASFHDAKT
jgi:hypothetical protein